jgi:hypothetical protein
VGEGGGDAGGRPAPVPLVLVQLRGERGEQRVDLGVEAALTGDRLAAQVDDQGADVGVPEPVGPGGEPPGAGLGARARCRWRPSSSTTAA